MCVYLWIHICTDTHAYVFIYKNIMYICTDTHGYIFIYKNIQKKVTALWLWHIFLISSSVFSELAVLFTGPSQRTAPVRSKTYGTHAVVCSYTGDYSDCNDTMMDYIAILSQLVCCLVPQLFCCCCSLNSRNNSIGTSKGFRKDLSHCNLLCNSTNSCSQKAHAAPVVWTLQAVVWKEKAKNFPKCIAV